MEMLRSVYLAQASVRQDKQQRGTTPDTNHDSVAHRHKAVAEWPGQACDNPTALECSMSLGS